MDVKVVAMSATRCARAIYFPLSFVVYEVVMSTDSTKLFWST